MKKAVFFSLLFDRVSSNVFNCGSNEYKSVEINLVIAVGEVDILLIIEL